MTTDASSAWRVLHGSVRGTSHAATGAPCQDASAVLELESLDGPVLVLACADGAGSASLSHEGAQLACSAVIGEVRDWLESHRLASADQAVVERWFLGVHAAVAERAAELETTPRELACTLLVAVLAQDDAIFAQVGDGGIVVDDGTADGYEPVFWPQSGEYANMTYFATDPEALQHLQVRTERGRRVSEAALFSDGLQALVLHYESRTAHAPFFRSRFAAIRTRPVRELADLQGAMLASLDAPAVNERTDDDKTLIMATRRGPETEKIAEHAG